MYLSARLVPWSIASTPAIVWFSSAGVQYADTR